MRSNFTYSSDALYRLKTGQQDRAIAKVATSEMIDFVNGRASLIEEYRDLVRVLDAQGIAEIRDAYLQICQIVGTYDDVTDHHRSGDLLECFDIPQVELKKAVARADRALSKLEYYVRQGGAKTQVIEIVPAF